MYVVQLIISGCESVWCDFNYNVDHNKKSLCIIRNKFNLTEIINAKMWFK